MKKAYLFLADGFETIEALTPVDVLRRCGVEVTTVSVTSELSVRSSHGICVEADLTMADCDCTDGQMVILPGGYPGYANLAESKEVGEIVKFYEAEGRFIAAICGAPTVLSANRIQRGCSLTCHSSVRATMSSHYIVTEAPVVKDRNIITANGAGNSLPFAFALAEALTDAVTVEEVKRKMEL